MNLGNNLFNARKKAAFRKKMLPKNWASADKRFPNGKPTKPCPIFNKPKDWRFYTIYP